MDPELIDALRADLDAADYRVAAVENLLGAEADASRSRGVFAPARLVLQQREASALTGLVRLFLLGEAIGRARLAEALPRLGASGAERLGLVGADDSDAESLVAALSVNPVEIVGSGASEHRWIISDLDDQLRRGPAGEDHVMGVGGATRSLLAQTPSHRVGRALDLGTGCGIVAMQLAGSADHVVATDISPRALELARANARLNGLDGRIDFRLGDLFAPVSGERFDRIVTNPPFVITPRVPGGPVYEYRDGGMVGDALAAAVVRLGPAHLAGGGEMICLANWECPWGVDGLERVREWVLAAAEEAGGLAAWVIERDRVSPTQYSETWARDGGARAGGPEFELLLERSIRDFSARHVVAVGLGSIRIAGLERSAPGYGETTIGEPDGSVSDSVCRVRVDRAEGALAPAQELGDLLEGVFRAGIAAESLSATETLATRWVLDAAVVEEREHRPGEESPRRITLTTSRPISRRVAADPLLAAAAGACDGELTLGQIAEALATLLEVDPEAAGDALVTGIRELVWLGMIAPTA